MDNTHQRRIVHTGPGMSAKWVGNGPVTNTGGGTGGSQKGGGGEKGSFDEEQMQIKIGLF